MSEQVQLRPSPIHGRGIFATARIAKGEQICGRIAYWFVNHADDPNGEDGHDDRGWCVFARRDIEAGEEVTLSYLTVEPD